MRVSLIGHDGEIYVNIDETIAALNERGAQYWELGDKDIADAIFDVTETFRDYVNELAEQIETIEHFCNIFQVDGSEV